MPNEQISDFTEGTDLAATDEFPAVDKSDTTDAATGTTKRFLWSTIITKLFGSRFGADAGASDTYVVTLVPAPLAYVTGEHYRFKANTANTGVCTVNFNSLGAKTIKKAAGGITTDLADNDIRAGQWVDLVYDGTNMQMQSLLGNAPAGGTGGIGDVVGPASATDNAIVRYDSTTGQLIQDSVVIVSDAGAITVPEIAAPSTPAAGTVHIYAKSDGKLYIKDDAGTETDLSGGGGSIAPLVIETTDRIFQRNGTTAQEFLVAKTWTDATHYEAVRIRSDSSNCFIEATHLNSSPPVLQVIAGTHLYLMSAAGGFNWRVRSDTGAFESGGSNGILCNGTLRVGSEAGFRSSSGAQGNLMHVTDNNLSTTPGALSFKRPVIAKTSSPESVTADETGFCFTNAGAGGTMNFNLPAATKGLTFTFYVDASQIITVTATNSHTIREGSTVGAANGNIASGATKGSLIRLTCFTDGEWVVEYRQLTWTIS